MILSIVNSLTLKAPTPQKGHTHSNSSLATAKNEEIATRFNNYFIDITKGLNIKKCLSPKNF